jgi:hypothetical protein
VQFVDGSFAAELGGDAAPISDAWLADDTLALSVAVSGGAPSAPVPVGWSPRSGYAARAGVAASVEGVLPRGNLPSQVAYTDGDATFTGAVTATGFTGSGAGLTSLPTSALTGTVARSNLPSQVAYTDGAATFTGAVTATGFTGSGAGLTNLPASAVTGATLSLTGTPTLPAHAVTLSHLDSRLAAYLPLTGGTLTGNLGGTNATFSGNLQATNLGVGLAPARPLDVSATALNVGLTSPAGPVRVILGNRDSAAIPGIIQSANGDVAIGRGTAFSDAAGGTFTPGLTVAAAGGASVTGNFSVSNNLAVGGTLSTGRTNVQNGLAFRDVAFYSNTASDAVPIHIKTNIANRSSHMYRIQIDGYNYGTASVIDHNVVGYMFASTDGITSGNTWGSNGGTTISQYLSSDGFLVVRLTFASSYFIGFGVSAWFTNPVGPNPGFAVTSIVKQSANL